MLENVDRLLKSPASQRGRDFAVMLASLFDLGYAVEWRVVNAADYGMPQRRRRVYIMGYKKGTKIYNDIKKSEPFEWLSKKGLTVNAFPVEEFKSSEIKSFEISNNLEEITKSFNKEGKNSPFEMAGMMIDGKVSTFKPFPKYKGKLAKLKNYLDKGKVPKEYFIDEKALEMWKYLKGGKKEERKSKDGFKYLYSEGGMAFPDNLNKPSRTIVTGEGGSAPSRFKHVIMTKSGKYRRLTPTELERLNMFPVNHTKEESPTKRAFFMGNALVVGVITKLGRELLNRLR
jgi:DNA (cytosine-5)-methyltransferase 1